MGAETHEQPASPFMPMFEEFKKELDEHHDRRERIIKASRDITAASKKIIFSLQRIRKLGEKLPHFVEKNNAQHWETIEKQYKSISSDLQGLNAYRYRQITGGNQEFMEAFSFQYYLEAQKLVSYEECKQKVASLSEQGSPVILTPEDYLLGVFDMVGELMRFSVTAMATSGKVPSGKVPSEAQQRLTNQDDGAVDLQETGEDRAAEVSVQQKPRDVLADLRELRLQLEMLEPAENSPFAKDVEKKMGVMKQCVEKVENALYGIIVRGKERPKGWVPDLRDERRVEEVESH